MVSSRNLAQVKFGLLFWLSCTIIYVTGKHTSLANRLNKEHESRGLLDTPPLAGLGSVVKGMLGSIALSVDESDKRPDDAHPYMAPGPDDQRGPCPGLNTLANHGYISRTGVVTAEEVIRGATEGFNMGVDVGTLLTFTSLSTTGNIASGKFSIGGEDNRTYSASGFGSRASGRQWGLDAHSRVETDASITREDFFLNNGDSHSGIGSRFARFVKLAQAHGGQFSMEAVNAMYGQNIRLSMANNPRVYQNGYGIIETLGEYPFVPGMFSNGTYGAGGVANYESISSLMGFQLNPSTGKFCFVPERFPYNWYRRSTPWTVKDLAANMRATYMAGPADTPNPLGAVLTNPDQLPQLECAIYQGFASFVPAALASEPDRLVAAVAYVQTKLLPLIPSTLGCPINVTTSSGDTTVETQDSLQERRPGGGQAYNVCS